MIDLAAARMLVRYNAWANGTLYDAVAALPAGEAARERPTLFKSIIGTLNHLYVVDRIWQAHLEGRDHGYESLATVAHAQLSDLRKAQAAFDAWLVDWVDALDPAALAGRIAFTLIGGNRGEMTRGEVVLHIVNHTSYHRGFVADLFYQVPARPPLTDLPVYLRQSEGAR